MATAKKQGDDDVSADDAAILAQIQALQARLSGNARGAGGTAREGGGGGGGARAAASTSSRTAPSRYSNQLAPPSPPRAGPSRSSSSSTSSSSSSSSYNGSDFIAQRARQGVEELKGQAQRYAAQPYRTSGGSYERQLQQNRAEAKPAGGYLAGLAARSAEREAQRGAENAAASSWSISSTSAPGSNTASSSSSTSEQATRDDRLRLMEQLDLKPGPWDFGDAKYADKEAYSGHRLRGDRITSHATFQEVMTGRYFLSPSLLYSIVQKPKGQTTFADGDYDVPVDGDFVVIATIVGSGPIWHSSGNQREGAIDHDVDDLSEVLIDETDGSRTIQIREGDDLRQKGYNRSKKEQEGCTGRNLDLLDMSAGDEDNTGGRGSDQLGCLLVQSDRQKNGKFYGGSQGAFEKLSPHACGGTVVAFINPLVLNSKQGSGKLMLKPRDADSVILIGTCRDYAQCQSIRKDGKQCTNHIDRRFSYQKVCSFHLESGVERTSRGRQEFANSTSTLFGLKSDSFKDFGVRSGKSTGQWGAKSTFGPSANNFSQSSTALSPLFFGRQVRDAYNFEGLQGRPKAFLVKDSNRSHRLKASHPSSKKFEVNNYYGREAVMKKGIEKKRQREEEVASTLSASGSRRDVIGSWREDATQLLASSQQASRTGATNEAHDEEDEPECEGGFDPTTHVGAAKALLVAKRTLEERKNKAEAARLEAEKKRLAKRGVVAAAAKKKQTATREAKDRMLIFGSSDSDEEKKDDQTPPSSTPPLTPPASGDTAAQDSKTGEEPDFLSRLQSSMKRSEGHLRSGDSQGRPRYTAEQIRLIGFDPLADPSASRERLAALRRAEQAHSLSDDFASRAEAASKRSRLDPLLARHTARPASLPKPRLKVPRSSGPNGASSGLPHVAAKGLVLKGPVRGTAAGADLKVLGGGKENLAGSATVEMGNDDDDEDDDLQII